MAYIFKQDTNGSAQMGLFDSGGTAITATAHALDINLKTSSITVPISGAVTANAGTNLNTSALALDTSVNGLLVAQASTTSGQNGPLAQTATTTNAPTYVTAKTNPLSTDTSGNLRISLKDSPSNTNNFNVNLAASAATITVTAANLQTNLNQIAGSNIVTAGTGIILAGVADGAGNKLTSNSSTYTAKFGLDANLLGTLGTAFSTPGKIDIKAADGDVFVRQATAANLNATVIGTGTFAVQAAQSGNWTARIVGNTGATIDSTVGAGTAPTNAIATAGIYNSTAPTPTAGQAVAIQLDQASNQRVFPGIALTTLSAWNSSTALNATQSIFTNSGSPAVLVQLDQTTTLSAGAITFEVSYDGTNWVTITANSVLDPTSTTYAQISLPYTLQASTNKPFIISNNGWQGLRIKLSTQITGSGTVTPYYALLAYDPLESVVAYSPTAANFNVTPIQGTPLNLKISAYGYDGANSQILYANGNGTQRIMGETASGSSITNAPITIGGLAKTALPTAVTDGQVVNSMHDKFGRQVVLTNAIRDLTSSQATTITASTSETTIVTAGGAGVFNDLASVIVVNTSATATRVDIRDATSGSVILTLYVPAGDMRGAAFSTPWAQTSANANWTATCGTSVTDVRITAQFIKNK